MTAPLILMLAVLALAVWAHRRQWPARGLIIGVSLVVVVASSGWCICRDPYSVNDGPSASALREQEQRLYYLQGQLLGGWMKQQSCQGEVLIIRHVEGACGISELEEAALRGLREGSGGALIWREAAAGGSAGETEVQRWNRLTDGRDEPFIISLCGLPTEPQGLDFWGLPEEQRPRLLLLNGSAAASLAAALHDGHVSAAVQRQYVDEAHLLSDAECRRLCTLITTTSNPQPAEATR